MTEWKAFAIHTYLYYYKQGFVLSSLHLKPHRGIVAHFHKVFDVHYKRSRLHCNITKKTIDASHCLHILILLNCV